MRVDGIERRVLVDTGCTRCIAHESCCRRWRKQLVGMIALNGGALQGQGIGSVRLQATDGLQAKTDVIISQTKPLGFDFIVGMNAIKALG
ncbi:hypothetical protein M513_10210 [Trichuris suis]|uniref:Peptidase A2 domain-containing protein n=1 Tax=Trichuris suis TaxID=68888 RepID=A0A085LV51_9BILA|nr:hypothetical protein M513_10210 [Trichuris suis]